MKAKRIWWLNPLGVYGLLLALVIYAYHVSDNRYMAVYGTNKYISLFYVLLYVICYLLFCLGFYLASKFRVTIGKHVILSNVGVFDANRIDWDRMIYTFNIIYSITILAYIIWYFNFFLHGGLKLLLLLRNFGDLTYTLRAIHNNASHISGITTFTELGIVVVAVAVMLVKHLDNMLAVRKIKRRLFIIIVLAGIRAFLFSERLAVIEIIVPIGIALLDNWDGYKYRLLIKILPILGIVALLFLFGILEYGRSWSRHYNLYYDSYVQFTIDRVTGYYINAINTECAYLSEVGSSIVPYRTLEWFWKLPFMGSIYKAITPVNVPVQYEYFLNAFVNPEFNNPGGMLVFVTDFSYFGILFYALYGFFVGRIYFRFVEGNIFGVCIYPCIYLTLLELPRFFMLGQSRGLCIMIGALYVNHRIQNCSILEDAPT